MHGVDFKGSVSWFLEVRGLGLRLRVEGLSLIQVSDLRWGLGVGVQSSRFEVVSVPLYSSSHLTLRPQPSSCIYCPGQASQARKEVRWWLWKVRQA